jgi:cytoskeleton protein RodZ
MSKVTHLTPDRSTNSARQKTDWAEAGESTGEALRTARERRGDDITSAARVLRIRKDHLEALEGNRLEELPGRTYAMGFVRSYAGYLGLDAKLCVERFKRETAGRGDSTPRIGFVAEPVPLALPYGRIFVTAVIVLVVLYGGYYLFRPIVTHSAQPVVPVPARIAASGPHFGQSTAPAEAARPKPAEQATAAPPGSSAASAAIPGVFAASAPPVSVPAGQTFGMQNKNVRVILRVRAATHLLVQGGASRVYLNRILHPGDAYRVPNLVGLLLTTPDGGAVSLELDGQNMGLAGQPGHMTEALSLDPQAIVDRSSAAKRG